MATAMIVVLQVGVPIGLLAWQAIGRDSNIIAWALKHGAVWSYLYAMTIAGLWLLLPWYAPHVLMIISVSLAARTLPGALSSRAVPANTRERLSFVARAGIAAVSLGVLWIALQGGRPPATPSVDLRFPLRSGQYYVANGGSTELLNAHVRMLSNDRFRRYRGASYGVDIIAVQGFGNRALGFRPSDPTRYAIFGDPVYAPCEGIAVRVEDGLPDLTPPHADRAHMAGNFVMLECSRLDDVHVLVAHMRRGSVTVHPGDYVTAEGKLGEVGNSGNSDEPHLHVHAQRPGRIWDLFSGEPLPITFDGRYLVRNDRVTIFADVSGVIDD